MSLVGDFEKSEIVRLARRVKKLKADNIELEKKLAEVIEENSHNMMLLNESQKYFCECMTDCDCAVKKRIEILETDLAGCIESRSYYKKKLVEAVEALKKIKYESLDDKTPVRYIAALMNWRDKVCSISFEALERIKGVSNE